MVDTTCCSLVLDAALCGRSLTTCFSNTDAWSINSEQSDSSMLTLFSLQSADIMIRSNVFPQCWVGPQTCCTMSNDTSMLAKRQAPGSTWLWRIPTDENGTSRPLVTPIMSTVRWSTNRIIWSRTYTVTMTTGPLSDISEAAENLEHTGRQCRQSSALPVFPLPENNHDAPPRHINYSIIWRRR